MARGPIITATVQLDDQVSKRIQQVEAEVIKVTKEGNVDAAQLQTVFGAAMRHISDDIRRAGETGQAAFAKMTAEAAKNAQEVRKTESEVRRLKRGLDDAEHSGSLLARTLKGIGSTALALGPALAHAMASATDKALEYEKALAHIRQQNGGDEAKTQRIADYAKDLVKQYPALHLADVVEGAGAAAAVAGQGEEGEKNLKTIMSVNAEASAALINSGQDPKGLEQYTKTFELMYGNKFQGGVDVATGERTPSYREFLDNAVRTQQAIGNFIDPTQILDLQKTGKLATRDLSARGLLNLTGLISEEGGQRVGTSAMSLSSALIGGHATKVGKEVMVKDLQLYDPKDLTQTKTGEWIPKAGAQLKDQALFKSDPAQWVHNVYAAAEARGMTQNQVDLYVQRALPRTAADLMVTIERQWETNAARRAAFDSAHGLKAASDQSPYARIMAATGKQDNAATLTGDAGLKSFADSTDKFGDAAQTFADAVKSNPILSGAAGQLGFAGKVLESPVGHVIGTGLSLFGGIGLAKQLGLLGKGAGGAAGLDVGGWLGGLLGVGGKGAAQAGAAGAVEAGGLGVVEAGGAAIAGLSPAGLLAGMGALFAAAIPAAIKGIESFHKKAGELKTQYQHDPSSLNRGEVAFLQGDYMRRVMEAHRTPGGIDPVTGGVIKKRETLDEKTAVVERDRLIEKELGPGAARRMAMGVLPPAREDRKPAASQPAPAAIQALAPQKVEVKGEAVVKVQLDLTPAAKAALQPEVPRFGGEPRIKLQAAPVDNPHSPYRK
jgi:hypothetical protein